MNVIDLLTNLHNLELDRIKFEKEVSAKKFTEEEASKRKEILKGRKRTLDTEKTRVLNNIIFPSMANVTRFLEFLLVSPYLNRAFERDLKSLLFAESKTSKNKEPVFARFIDACCWSKVNVSVSKRGKIKSNVPLSDFRLILMQIMMDKIWMMMPGIGESKFKNDTFLNNVLYADFGRAVSWMKEFAHEPHGRLVFDRDKRPALF